MKTNGGSSSRLGRPDGHPEAVQDGDEQELGREARAQDDFESDAPSRSMREDAVAGTSGGSSIRGRWSRIAQRI